MSIVEALEPVQPPLRLVDGNAYRIGNSRIPLERVIHAFNHGSAPEEIAHKFPTLALADVYAVIAFYLRNQEAVDAYVSARKRGADDIEQQVRAEFPSDDLRAKLESRRARKP